MGPKVIEGAWEDVIRRAHELAGHRVRVTVLDEPAAPAAGDGTDAGTAPESTAFDVLSRAGLIGCLKGGGPTDLATNPAHLDGFGDE